MARAKAIWTRMDEATINTRASIALNTSHGIGTGNKRYRHQMPCSRSATSAVGSPKHAPPSIVMVTIWPI